MHILNYSSFKKFKGSAYKMIHSCKCGSSLEIFVEESEINIEGKMLHFEDLHILKCIKCDSIYLPFKSSQLIEFGYREAIKNGQTVGSFKRTSYREKFSYCENFDLIYDYYDYYNIPGLMIDEEHTQKGFLAPVYFDKKVFHYFFMDENYQVNLFAETYGTFSLNNDWGIPFGINENDKIVFWLGDLDTIDEKTLAIMKPFNVASDHKLINSEFYAAQLCCTWAKPNLEHQIYINRNKFYNNVQKIYGLNLYHLENEVKTLITHYNKPISVNKTTFINIIATLHKVIIEAVDTTSLKEICKCLPNKDSSKLSDLKCIKLYEFILTALIQDVKKVSAIIAPLYILNDLRIYFDHLLSDIEQKKLEQNIVKVLQLNNMDEVYTKHKLLLERLNNFYSFLNLIICEEQ